jgi:hypothetical protein
VTYKDFRAEVKPGSPLNFRKNCQFNLQLPASPGDVYTAVSAEYVGSARLARGIRAQQETSYYFNGQRTTVTRSYPLSGPLTGPWRHTEHLALSALGKEGCGQAIPLAINAQLLVFPGVSSGPASYLALDSAVHAYTVYRFTRTRCY